MSHETETLEKFLSTLKVDQCKDIKYIGKKIGYFKCVCGQPITKAYIFYNKQNEKRCNVGKNCLHYIAMYLGW